ncbi:MAG: hypothetical protein RR907_15465, partial [Comamonas sp.]
FFAALSDEFVFVLRGGVFYRGRGVLFSHENESASVKRRLKTKKVGGWVAGGGPKPAILSFLTPAGRSCGKWA